MCTVGIRWSVLAENATTVEGKQDQIVSSIMVLYQRSSARHLPQRNEGSLRSACVLDPCTMPELMGQSSWEMLVTMKEHRKKDKGKRRVVRVSCRAVF